MTLGCNYMIRRVEWCFFGRGVTLEALIVWKKIVGILEPEIKESRRSCITIGLYILGKVDGQG